MAAATAVGRLRFAQRAGRPLVMGVVNVTPDSFSDGGRFLDAAAARAHALRLIGEGADILDIGGESTRPGAEPLAEAEERGRVLPVIDAVRRESAIPISIDTMKPGVARAAMAAGADVWNDVAALRAPGALEAAAALGAPVILMHMLGEPRSMQDDPRYADVVAEVIAFLRSRAAAAEAAGLAPELIAVDPGIGFGKTLAHNLALIRAVARIRAETGKPLVLGASRKRFIRAIDPAAERADDRLGGSLAAALAAAEAGADVIRVHDVAATVQALEVQAAIRSASATRGRSMTQSNTARAFAALHVKGRPLILYNAWDAGSAKAIADAGAPAIATGSWSVAAAQGYGDGQAIPLALAVQLVERIVASVDLPVTMDFEGGYAVAPEAVADNAGQVIAAGCVGINFEDQVVGGEGLHPVEEQARRIAAIRRRADDLGVPLFINARTDVFMKETDKERHGDLLSEAAARAAAYRDAGASGLFAPGLVSEDVIAGLCDASPLPVNIMMKPDAPPVARLAAAGVARVSHGPFPYLAAMAALTERAREALAEAAGDAS